MGPRVVIIGFAVLFGHCCIFVKIKGALHGKMVPIKTKHYMYKVYALVYRGVVQKHKIMERV